MICSTVVNLVIDKNATPTTPEDFIPKLKQEVAEHTAEQQEAAWKADLAFAEALKKRSQQTFNG